ncbi:MAG: heme-binding domain-containing protein [Flavobacteriales bacterium]|nr:heme-binding domain-containing protein [Flavobacteriales bacterium]MCB9167864.1 heme-binding domain-containing protein [Flavobacteriales bacterium]
MKRWLLILIVLLGVAQFIRPDTSVPAYDPAQDLLAMTKPSTQVEQLVRAACYDCHSYESEYPWYDRITPVNWWVHHHVEEARHHGNLSIWGTLAQKRKDHFLKDAPDEIGEGDMPLPTYTWMHPKARLTDAQRKVLIDFFSGLRGPGAADRDHAD